MGDSMRVRSSDSGNVEGLVKEILNLDQQVKNLAKIKGYEQVMIRREEELEKKINELGEKIEKDKSSRNAFFKLKREEIKQLVESGLEIKNVQKAANQKFIERPSSRSSYRFKEDIKEVIDKLFYAIKGERKRYNEVKDRIKDPGLSDRVKNQLIQWLAHHIRKSGIDHQDQEAVSPINEILNVSGKKSSLKKGHDELEEALNPTAEERIPVLKKHVEAFQSKYPNIPKEVEGLTQYQRELVSLMDEITSTLKSANDETVDRDSVETLFSIQDELHKTYKMFSTTIPENFSIREIDKHNFEMLKALISTNIKIRSVDLSSRLPATSTEETPQTSNMLIKNYKELIDVMKAFPNRIEQGEKLLYQLYENTKVLKHKAILSQTLFDIKTMRHQFEKLATAVTFEGEVPTLAELEKMNRAYLNVQKVFSSVARIVNLTSVLNDIDLKSGDKSKSYREYRDQFMKDAGYNGQTANTIFMVPQQILVKFTLLLRDLVKNESAVKSALTEERMGVLKRMEVGHAQMMKTVNDMQVPMQTALETLKESEIEEALERFSVQNDLEWFHQRLENLGEDEKIRVEDGMITVLPRKGKGKPDKSIVAIGFYLDRIARAAELGIFTIQVEGQKIPLENLLDSEAMREKKWAQDMFNATEDLKSSGKRDIIDLVEKRNLVEQKIKAAKNRAKGGEAKVIKDLKEYKLPDKLLKEIDGMIKRRLSKTKDKPGLERRKKVLEGFPKRLEMVLKMYPVKNRDLYTTDELKGIVTPEELLKNYKNLMPTFELLSDLKVGIHTKTLSTSRKVVFFNFLKSFIHSEEHQKDVFKHQNRIGEIIKLAERQHLPGASEALQALKIATQS